MYKKIICVGISTFSLLLFIPVLFASEVIINTESISLIYEGDGSTDITLQFGSSIIETLSYSNVNSMFSFSKGISVAGTISGTTLQIHGTGTSYTLGSFGVGTNAIEGALSVSGSTVLTNQTSGTTPSSGKLSLFSKSYGGRPLINIRDQFAQENPLQPSFFGNQIVMISPNTTNSVNAFGNTVASVGTLSHPVASQAYGWMTNFLSTAVANSTAGTGNTNTLWFRGSGSGANGYFYHARLAFPDLNYGTGATGARMFAGLTSGTMAASVGNNDPAGDHSGFQFTTSRFDGNWQFMTRDNTAQNLVNTGMPFVAGKVYDMYIYCPPESTTIYWQIDNITDSTTTSGNTANRLPRGNIPLRGGFQISTLSATARNVRMQRVYMESNR